jgi:hypothetical protein
MSEPDPADPAPSWVPEEKVATPAGEPQRYRCTNQIPKCLACDRLGYHIHSWDDVPEPRGAATRLRSYYLPSSRETADGYAYIMIDTEIGLFSTVSDWGNYGYLWSHPGCEFRKFLARLEPDYLLSKLMSGRPDMYEYDDRKTRRAVFERLRDLARFVIENPKHEETRAFYEKERDLYREHKRAHDFWSVEDFRSWYEATSLSDAYECHETVPNRQCWSFCTKTWPRFVELLRKELDEERSKAESPTAETRG